MNADPPDTRPREGATPSSVDMDVFVANEQSDVVLDERRLVELARVAAEEEGVPLRSELSILLLERPAMGNLKEKYFGEPGVTDVLAFPMDDQTSSEEPHMLGDIVICPDVAREQAEENGSTVLEEVELLLVHGFLHLVGYDHVQPQDARMMRHRERKIIQEFYRSRAV